MEAFEISAILRLDTSEMESKMSGVGDMVKGFLGASAIQKGIGMLKDFGKESIKAGMDFDTSMSQVGATLGYTVADMNNPMSEAGQNMAKLSEFAQEMGRTTKFSANESAEALNYMALAGYDAEKSMDTLPKVMNLAAAGSMDLARASDMVTDAETALGLTSDETTTMIDQMAKTASSSNTSVEQLGDAILTIGGTAKTMAGGTEELNSVLGVLANNGIKGSEAGTHLRNMLLKLSSPTSGGAKALQELGVEIFDAEGKMRSFSDIFPEMNAAMSSLTDEQKTQALSEIFNTRDIASANALLATSSEEWDKLGDAIIDSKGAAEEMAAVQLDNLEGDVTLFKSALEGTQIALTKQLTPAFRTVVQGATDMLSGLTEAFQQEGFGGVIDKLGEQIRTGLPKLMERGVEIVTSLGEGIMQNIPKLLSFALDIITGLANGIIKAVPKLILVAPKLIIALAKGLITSLPQLLAKIPQMITSMVKTFLKSEGQFMRSGISLMKKLLTGIINGFASIPSRLWSLITKLPPKVIDIGGRLLSAGASVMRSLWSGISSILSSIPSRVAGLVSRIPSAIRNGIGNLFSIGSNVIQGLWNGLKSAWSGLFSWFTGKVDSLKQKAKSLLGIASPSKEFAKIGKWIPAGLAVGIESNMGLVESAINDMASITGGEYGGTWNGDGFGHGVQITNYITVDGAENPESFANRLVRQMELQVRGA